MKAHDWREMAPGELRGALDELYQELFNLRFQLSGKQLTNTSRMKQVKRDIARVKTVLGESEQGMEAI